MRPIVDGAIEQRTIGRWTEYVVDESYPPTLLVRKARKLQTVPSSTLHAPRFLRRSLCHLRLCHCIHAPRSVTYYSQEEGGWNYVVVSLVSLSCLVVLVGTCYGAVFNICRYHAEDDHAVRKPRLPPMEI